MPLGYFENVGGLVMGELVFVGLGLHDEFGITLRGLEEIRSSDNVFIELYTNFMPNFSLERLRKLCDKEVLVVSRKQLEDESGRVVLEAAEKGKAVLLVPGDPLIATTHISLRTLAEKKGIKTRIVHGASIISAVIGLSGLHNYKFGKSVTIAFPQGEVISETPYEVIEQNKRLGLHTLCLLDVQVENRKFMTIAEAVEILAKIERERKRGVITSETLAVGISGAGSRNPIVKADVIDLLKQYDFGVPPHSLIFPGKLHFMEAEALKVFADAPADVVEAMVE